MIYDWCIPEIYQFSVCLCNYIATIEETAATTQIRQVLITAKMKDVARTHEKSLFTQKVHTTGICRTNTYWSYLISSMLPGLPGHGSALGRIRPGLDADTLNFSDRKPSNSRLGPVEFPPPGVALVNMTAPAGSPPLTVSTPKLIRLFRPRCVFVRNRRCGVSIKKARKLEEWHPSKTVPILPT